VRGNHKCVCVCDWKPSAASSSSSSSSSTAAAADDDSAAAITCNPFDASPLPPVAWRRGRQGHRGEEEEEEEEEEVDGGWRQRCLGRSGFEKKEE